MTYAVRGLRKHPAFTVAIVLSLALGIGANTAIFTLMDAVLWRMLPVSDPGSLLIIARRDGRNVRPGFTYDEFRLLRDSRDAAQVAGSASAPIHVSVDGPAEPTVQGQLVTGNYFALLGVRAAIGRTIGPEDDRVPNGHPVVMLSDGYWERRFARDPAVVGRTVRLSALPFTVIGVTPPGFFGVEVGSSPDLFLPIMMQPTVMPAVENLLEDPLISRTWVQAIARTRPGTSAEQAAAVLDAVLRGDARDASAPHPNVILTHTGAVSVLRRQFSLPLFVLQAMVGLVLLTACANTANLLLARASARRPEFAMRLALGASRPRLVRQLLVESLVLASIGGLFGLLVASWTTELLLAYISSGRTPITLDVTPNSRILAFTTAVSLLTGVLFGLAPAWRLTRIDLQSALKGVRGSVTRGLRFDRVLSIAQLALSLVLLIAAGLFARSLQNLAGDDNGLRQRVITTRVEPKGSDQRGIAGTAERLDRTYQDLMRLVRDLPDVQMASMANTIPTAPTSTSSQAILLPSGLQVRIPVLMVYPNYFSTIGVPLLRGRDFTEADLQLSAPAVCIVNESFARQMFPEGDDPIGKPCATRRRPRLLSTIGQADTPMPAEPFAIVGVVRDSRYSNPRGETRPVIYSTFLQTNTGRGQMVLHVRTSGNQGAVIQRIREAVATLDPALPMFDVRTLEEEMNAALVQQRLIALLSGVFGGLALVLACVGLYGLLAFTIMQRKHEIGIRMALGARRAMVVRLVLCDALLLVAVGIAIGVPAALAVARLASSQISGLVFGLESTDALTIAGAIGTLTAVAALAAYLPARRASQIDPLVVFRSE
ncbi:MAG: ABC transporter permease [Vicinamibacterales bacterium]